MADNIFDFSAIEELDPSLSDGYQIIYDREVPLEVRHQNSSPNDHSISVDTKYPTNILLNNQNQGTLESIKVKILVLGDDDHILGIRIELSSEADLFFHYMHIVDEERFNNIKSIQSLMVDFNDYANIFIKMINNCIREPHIFLAILTITNDIDAKLDLIQNMEYKYIELLSCEFERSSEIIVQHHITYRYNLMKTKLNVLQGRVHEIVNLVKMKNPSLLLQLQKSTTSTSNTTNMSPRELGSAGGMNGSFSQSFVNSRR